MLMPITKTEQRIYEDKIHLLNEMELEEWASNSFSDKYFRLVFIKAMYNLIQDSVQERRELSDTSLLDDNELAKDVLEEVLLKVVKVATFPRKERTLKVKAVKNREVKGYSTGQLATFFGVSTTTINNWINEGRFLQELENGQMVKVARKATNEKIKIHPDTWFDAPSGVRYQIKELVKAYEEDKKEWEASKQANTVSEQEQIQSYLEYFKNKYNGKDFYTVFGNRDWNNMTAEEETDAAMWSFFLERISSGEDTRD